MAVVDAEEGRVLGKSKPHSKYCVRVLWDPAEPSRAVTASWDNSMVVQRWQQQGEGQLRSRPILTSACALPTVSTHA